MDGRFGKARWCATHYFERQLRYEYNRIDRCRLCFVTRTRHQRNDELIDEIKAGLPFLDIAIAELGEFDDFVDDVFATDRYEVPKGMIEVLL